MESIPSYLCKMDEKNEKEITLENCLYTWTIENFSTFQRNSTYVVVSPEVGRNKKCMWKINLYPIGWGQGTSDYIGMFLRLTSAPPCKIFAQFTFSLLNSTNLVISSRSHECTIEKNPRYGFPKFEKREKIIKRLPDDIMKIQVKISCVLYTMECGHKNLAQDFYFMLCNQIFCDIVLVAGRHKFKAHKSVLSARSPVFAAMLSHDFVESQNGEITIPDFCPTTVHNLLLYIYTEKFNVINVEEAIDLLLAAEKYNLENLKARCCEFLSSQLNEDCVSDILYIAEKCSLSELKMNTMNYIFDNICFFTELQPFRKFEVLHPKLLSELIWYFKTRSLKPKL